jgi:hypothetical protein
MSDVSSINQKIPFSINSNICIGQIVDISDDGKLFVDYAGSTGNRREAKCLDGVIDFNDCKHSLPISVLLVFTDVNLSLPIIIGKVLSEIQSKSNEGVVRLPRDKLKRDVSIDGERVLLDGTKEIVLRCGKSSIVMRKNGKIIMKGTEIISRSSGSNKIKGATININ